MKKIIALVGLIILIGVGYYIYTVRTGVPADPLAAYQKITGLPVSQQAEAFQKTANSWIQDPSSLIPYPKGWKTVSVTMDKETFDVITPDQANPPTYYVSTSFPRDLMSKVTISKCIDVNSKGPTEWCAIGNNAQVNAYFSIIQWIKDNSAFSAQSIINGLAPKMDMTQSAQ